MTETPIPGQIDQASTADYKAANPQYDDIDLVPVDTSQAVTLENFLSDQTTYKMNRGHATKMYKLGVIADDEVQEIDVEGEIGAEGRAAAISTYDLGRRLAALNADTQQEAFDWMLEDVKQGWTISGLVSLIKTMEDKKSDPADIQFTRGELERRLRVAVSAREVLRHSGLLAQSPRTPKVFALLQEVESTLQNEEANAMVPFMQTVHLEPLELAPENVPGEDDYRRAA